MGEVRNCRFGRHVQSGECLPLVIFKVVIRNLAMLDQGSPLIRVLPVMPPVTAIPNVNSYVNVNAKTAGKCVFLWVYE